MQTEIFDEGFKRCFKCREILPLNSFHKDKSHSDGKGSSCKKCVLGHDPPLPQEILPDHLKRCSRCREVLNKNNFGNDKGRKDKLCPWCKSCKSIIGKESWKNANEETRAQVRKNGQRYRDKHRNKYRQRINNWDKNRRQTDPIYRFQRSLRSSLWYYLFGGKQGKKTFDILGYTKEEFQDHFNQFIEKPCPICKCKYTNRFEIDHIYPISKAKNRDEVIKLNQLDNLRLLCKTCNVRKGNKIENC